MKNLSKYDVIIIGAGPAGLSCARELADSDLSVLIIDKSTKPGHKLCAGGIRIVDMEHLGINISKFKGCEILKAEDYGEIVDFTTIDRRFLSQHQFQLLDKAENIDKLLGYRISDIVPGSVILNYGDSIKNIFFEYLVAADGSSSKTRQKLGIINRNKLILSFIQSDLPIRNRITEFKTLEFCYNRELFGDWYAYIFPHHGLKQVKIGCGGSVAWIRQNQINLRKNLEIWMRGKSIQENIVDIQGALINADYQGYDFTKSMIGKVFLCGEAAGLANYYSGEGIHQALVSGSETGKMILNTNYIPERLKEIVSRKQHEIYGFSLNQEKGMWRRLRKILHR